MSSMLIPSTRPVIGEDLDRLRERMGMTTGEACWLYGYSMTKWTKIVKTNAKLTLNKPTMALLARALDARPDLTPLPKFPSAHDIYAYLREIDPTIDKKRFSILFGCEASSGYRWITADSEISPALARLFLVFERLYNQDKGKKARAKLLETWQAMVEAEAHERGISNVLSVGRWNTPEGAEIGRPVKGEDIDSLREQMGLATMDACWLFGFSITSWTDVVKNEGAKKPLRNVTLALLVRVLRAHPEVSPLSAPPDARTVFEAISVIDSTIDRKRMAILFGCEASSGYRWLTTGSTLGPALMRLFKLFMMHYAEVEDSRSKREVFLHEWTEMVLTEARARGAINVFSSGRWVATAEVARKRSAPRKITAVKPLPPQAFKLQSTMGPSATGVITPSPAARKKALLTPEMALAKAVKQKSQPRT